MGAAATTWARNHRVLTTVLLLAAGFAAVWVVKLVQVQRSVASYADHWSQPQGEPGGLLYVALGDSAAQGIGASRPERGYVGLLAQRLRDATGQPVQVINLSRSGAVLGDVLDTQLPALVALGRTPDLLTVAIGGNDIRAYDRAAFAAQAASLTAALPPQTYVADAPYFMHGRWEEQAQQAADVLGRATREHGLHPVALHAAQRAEGWQAMLTEFAADWFHPNDRGHRVWADAFWAQINARPLP